MGGKRYTKGERIAIGMMAKTCHAGEIADEFGRTEAAIKEFCKQKRIRFLAPRPCDGIHRAAIMNCLILHPGISGLAIARMLKRKQGSVSSILLRMERDGLVTLDRTVIRKDRRFRPAPMWLDAVRQRDSGNKSSKGD